jgi:DNA replication and repair protein RecF
VSRLQQIDLLQFKNHPQSHFAFGQRITAITGPNGAGKTNLLDAIHYLCFARSYFTRTDQLLTAWGQQGFRVSGVFEKNEKAFEVACIVREDGGKEVNCQGELFKKLSGYLGRFSCVMICPDDIALVNEGSENRRRFLDTILCQANNGYLQNLQQYNKVLTQRNSLLKQFAETGRRDMALLKIYDEQLLRYGQPVFELRTGLCAELVPLVNKHYRLLSGGDDGITLQYKSPLQDAPFEQLLAENVQKDMAMQRTRYGPHRDDVLLLLREAPVKQSASQGQKKTLLLALKLAELVLLGEALDSKPILLLDDIFEKLDGGRLERLIEFVTHGCTNTVFLTDTSAERVSQVLNSAKAEWQLAEVKA